MQYTTSMRHALHGCIVTMSLCLLFISEKEKSLSFALAMLGFAYVVFKLHEVKQADILLKSSEFLYPETMTLDSVNQSYNMLNAVAVDKTNFLSINSIHTAMDMIMFRYLIQNNLERYIKYVALHTINDSKLNSDLKENCIPLYRHLCAKQLHRKRLGCRIDKDFMLNGFFRDIPESVMSERVGYLHIILTVLFYIQLVCFCSSPTNWVADVSVVLVWIIPSYLVVHHITHRYTSLLDLNEDILNFTIISASALLLITNASEFLMQICNM